jgi:hypothetical protein
VQSVRLLLCARGVNGYTLDDTGHQPQNNVVGTTWWDDVSLHEPESTAAELSGRGVVPMAAKTSALTLRVDNLDLGERLLGENVLTGSLYNSEPNPRTLSLVWEFVSPTGKKSLFKSSSAAS